MNFKTTYVLFGVLIGVLVLFLLSQLLGKRTTDTDAYVFPTLHETGKEIKPKDIQTVTVKVNQPQEQELVFQRSEQGWRLQQPNIRADGRQVDRVIEQVIDANVNAKAELPSSRKQAGLEPPRAVVTLKDKDGKEWSLSVGDNTIGEFDSAVYVHSSDRKDPIVAVRRAELDSLFKTGEKGSRELALKGVNDYRSTEFFPPNAMDYQYVKLEGAKQGPVILERKGTENRWMFKEPPYGEADYAGEVIGMGREGAQEGGVSGLLSSLGAFKVDAPEGFVADDVKDLGKYGLAADSPERVRIEVKTQNLLSGVGAQKEPVTTVLLLGKKVDGKEDSYYAALDEGNKYPRSVVKVAAKPRDQVVKLLQNPSPLRTRDLVSLEPAQLEKIDWIEVNNGKETFQLRRTGHGNWDLLDKSGKAKKADPATVAQLYQVLMEKRTIKDYADEKKTDADLGLDRPAATIAFWVDGQKEEKKEEKKEDKKDDKKDPKAEEKKEPPTKPQGAPAVKLVLGAKDKGNVYVLRELGGDKVRAAVPEALLNRLTTEKLAYYDRELPGFERNEVEKLVLTRGGETLELDKEPAKDGKPALWKFTRPDSLKGRTADASKVVRVLDVLSRLFADKILEETSSEAELKRYGLDAPAVQVTVTLRKDDKKTETRTYSFGKEADDKSGRVNARTSDRDWVLLIGPHVLPVLKDELADTTIFTFDPSKVKTVKMAGWKEVTGTPWKFDLERKSKGVWTVKAPADFKIDEGKVEKLVEALSKLQAIKFVALKSGAKPEHKLKVGEGALEIGVSLEGEKEPITLTIGAPASADKGHFATSNKLPGDVFVLPEGLFADILKRPAYFASSTAEK